MWFLLELSESPQFSTVVGLHIRVIFILQLESVFDIPYHTSHDKAHLHKQGNIDKYIWAICGCAHCASQWRLWHFDINVSRMILVQIISSQQFHSSKHTLTLSPAFSPPLSLFLHGLFILSHRAPALRVHLTDLGFWGLTYYSMLLMYLNWAESRAVLEKQHEMTFTTHLTCVIWHIS